MYTKNLKISEVKTVAKFFNLYKINDYFEKQKVLRIFR